MFCAVNFLNEANQTKEVFDPEKSTPGRYSNKWILRTNVSPLKRYRRFAPLGVDKENTTLAWQAPYAINFKLDISVRVKWVNDPEGFVVKALMGRI